MTLRFSTSDNYANRRDNLADSCALSRQRRKSISSGDSFAFHPTTAPASSALNKVTDSSSAFGTVAQAKAPVQKISRQIINNFLARFIERTCAHICVLVPAGTKECASRHQKLAPKN